MENERGLSGHTMSIIERAIERELEGQQAERRRGPAKPATHGEGEPEALEPPPYPRAPSGATPTTAGKPRSRVPGRPAGAGGPPPSPGPAPSPSPSASPGALPQPSRGTRAVALPAADTEKSLREEGPPSEPIDGEAASGEGSQSLPSAGPAVPVEDAEVVLPATDVPGEAPPIKHEYRSIIAVGLLVLLLVVGGFGAWATLVPLQVAVVVTGEVKLAGGDKPVQHLEGGILREVLVEDGTHVEAGQVLARLDDTQSRARLQGLDARYKSLRVREARLIAERDGTDAIAFSPEILEMTGDGGDTAALMTAQENLFRARRDALSEQLKTLEERIKQYENQISGYEVQRRSTEEQLGYIKEELTAAKTLFDKGIYEKPRLLALQRNSAALKGTIGQYTAQIASTNDRISETRSQMASARTQRLSEVSRELQEVQSDLLDATEKRNAARDILERTVVRAPYAGTVVALRYRASGVVLPAGASILSLVAGDDSQVVEVKVKPTDVDSLKLGMRADVLFTGFSRRTTPRAEGTLAYISADRLQDPAGYPYYLARIEMTSDSMKGMEGVVLSPGMPAEVHIATSQRTALSYVLKPILDSFRRAVTDG